MTENGIFVPQAVVRCSPFAVKSFADALNAIQKETGGTGDILDMFN